jgi:class 3 adenylate cyclase
VNIAARLETHTKTVALPILIDDATRAGLGADITVEPLGPVSIRGKSQSVDVFAVPVGQKS